MGLLQQIQRGRTYMPPRMLVYGTEGIGKSTLAASTPKPIFVQTEDGLGEIECDKFPLARSFDDVMAALADAGANVPVVLHKQNRKPWVAIVRLDDLPQLAVQLYLTLAETA